MTTQQEWERTNDCRQADVDYARQLLDGAEQSGLVALPTLTVDELLILGAADQAIQDATISRAWEGLPDQRRYQLADAAIAGLVERGLLDSATAESCAVAASSGSNPPHGTGEERMRVHPALATILLARTFPTWVALCSTQDGRRTDLRMFGLGDTQNPYRGVVVETLEHTPPQELPADISDMAAATSYHYRLASTAAAATLLADWAIAMDATAHLANEPARAERLIDLFVHRDGEPLLRWRIQAHLDRQGNAYVRTGQQHEPHDRDSLTELLRRVVSTLRSG